MAPYNHPGVGRVAANLAVITQLPNVTEVSAWVSYLDVYGFKAIVGTSEVGREQNELYSRLSSIHSQLLNRINKNTTLHILSDNYFLINPVGDDPISAYEHFLADIRAVINLHIAADLPIRGGVAYGRVETGPNVLVGRAVIRAVHYEKLCRVPLVMLPAKEVELANIGIQPPKFVDHHVVDEHSSPGIVSATFVVPVNPRSYVEYCENKYNHLRIYGPEKVAKDWSDVSKILSKICGSVIKGDVLEHRKDGDGKR